ncbi:lipase 2 [Rhodococcoides trifolii]|uniref:Lipase 2 n=1 Tax=Rhodococcoides trifolii TaxID=908250 RepID=A0A917CY84_9NOCA|nr:SGNH/GDSL hydrolase family protein [Rhodococcus trifolii]GGG00794.1 lipase 2 [Rhodococcus trifolii]
MVLAGLVSPPIANATPTEYANLGDSFTAATGVLPLAAGAPLECLQSDQNFAHIVARRQGYDLTDISCGGAATDDFYSAQSAGTRPQLDALSPSTGVVTVMIGGNDSSIFSGAVTSCVNATLTHLGVADPCEQQYGNKFDDTVLGTTLPAVRQALRDIHSRAPRARVVAVGYPWLLPSTGSCAPFVPVALGDVPFLRRLQTTLNDSIRRAAVDTGTTFVDMSVVSEGHDACQPVGVRWVEPLIGARQPVPLHPNALGEQVLATEVTKVLSVG